MGKRLATDTTATDFRITNSNAGIVDDLRMVNVKWHTGEPPEGVDEVLVWDPGFRHWCTPWRGEGCWRVGGEHGPWKKRWIWQHLPTPPEDSSG